LNERRGQNKVIKDRVTEKKKKRANWKKKKESYCDRNRHDTMLDPITGGGKAFPEQCLPDGSKTADTCHRISPVRLGKWKMGKLTTENTPGNGLR